MLPFSDDEITLLMDGLDAIGHANSMADTLSSLVGRSISRGDPLMEEALAKDRSVMMEKGRAKAEDALLLKAKLMRREKKKIP